MTTEERIKLVAELRDVVRSEDGNAITLLCLIAMMTDSELIEFHSSILAERQVKKGKDE